MDFALNADQQAILSAVEKILSQCAGPARATALNRDDRYDTQLQQRLDDAGFGSIASELATAQRSAGLEAALIVEVIARAGGVIASAAQMLVAPAVVPHPVSGPIALCTHGELSARVPLRYAAHATSLLVLHADQVRLMTLESGDMQAVRSSFGYPMGRAVDATRLATKLEGAEQLGSDAADAMANWWRLALAVEAVGTMDGALQHTIDYLKQRRQFGHAIASFQAIQHRLAHCAILVEASRWLAREAAYHGAPREAVAAAAAFALQAADQVFSETHQMSGAIGFTREFALHVWSMRLLALRQELGGVGAARRALVDARWGVHSR